MRVGFGGVAASIPSSPGVEHASSADKAVDGAGKEAERPELGVPARAQRQRPHRHEVPAPNAIRLLTLGRERETGSECDCWVATSARECQYTITCTVARAAASHQLTRARPSP